MASGNATHFVVQSFYLQGKSLKADQARQFNTAELAIGSAKRLAERKAGARGLLGRGRAAVELGRRAEDFMEGGAAAAGDGGGVTRIRAAPS